MVPKIPVKILILMFTFWCPGSIYFGLNCPCFSLTLLCANIMLDTVRYVVVYVVFQ